ncbi:HAD-IIIA family hydrolase [Bacillus thuringiensis]|uniref:HAD-IIIA family hydrolase n=1 Tax=Bacillus thuringiensis TaxID=1428 RepID=UPI002408F571|nr:HAD-IIIA family hydrolase [Bacillus thuringiensis]MDZ3953499.1 HAD-IIIA family hydrolase [Bacillus thuringiensis]
MAKKKAIFLDRDGVINQVLTDRVKFVNKPEDIYLLPGAADAIAIFNRQGYMVLVTSNQGGVGLGYMTQEELCDLNHNFAVLAKLWFFLFVENLLFQKKII